MLIDLHVHSDVSSCSVMSVDDILTNARSLGLDGVCITDHNTTDVLSQIDEGFQSDGLLVMVGMEYATPQGDFLAYGDVSDLPRGMDYVQLRGVMHERGGVVVAAHPFRGWRPTDPLILKSFLPDAVEVVNGRNTDAEDAQALALADRLSLPRTGGSDAHALDELGRFPTRFTVPVASMDDLVEAIRLGQCESGFPRELLASAS